MKIKIFNKLFLLILLLIPLSVLALDYPKINSKYIEIYDLNDNKILYEMKANDVIPIASLTKIATAMVAIENVSNIENKVVITSNMLKTVSAEAHVVGLKAGDKVTYKDLLYATIVSSGADAANSLAILCSGSLDKHVEAMNTLAKKIGLEKTHFKNVTGLDNKDNYSTPDEVRKLLFYALDNNLFKEIYTTKKYKLSNGLTVNTTLKLYDKKGSLDTSKILGSKTGFTSKAGYCLASMVDINGHKILIITFKAEKKGNNYYNIIDALDLVKYMLKSYKDEILVEKDQLIKELPVNLSNINTYSIKASQEISKYLPRDYDINNLKITYEGEEELNYFNREGEKIGAISYYFEDELLLKEDVILNQDIVINFKKVLQKYYYIVIIFVVLVILMIIFFFLRKRKKNK